jgi:WD40 repeat protein
VGSWDKTLRVYDEAASDKDDPLLRTVQCAHAADITSIALSHSLGLIATGAADGSVKVYTNQALALLLCIQYAVPSEVF